MPGHYQAHPPKKAPKPPKSPFDEQSTSAAAGIPVKGTGSRKGLDTTKWGN